MNVWQIITTLPSREAADQIAASLIEDRLAACVQIDGPIQSTYRWQEAVANEAEWRCTIKTSEQRLDDCISGLRTRHPYDVPEIIATAAGRVDQAYADWVESQVS